MSHKRKPELAPAQPGVDFKKTKRTPWAKRGLNEHPDLEILRLEAQVADQLLKETREDDFYPQERSTIFVYGRTHKVPRDQTFLRYDEDKDDTANYSYSRGAVPEGVMTPSLRNLCDRLNKDWKLKMRHVLCNRYFSVRNDYVAEHKDNGPKTSQDHPIISVSLGVARRFQVIDKEERVRWEGLLRHGDVVVMKAGMQARYYHSVPKLRKSELKQAQPDDVRVNLTFRTYLA